MRKQHPCLPTTEIINYRGFACTRAQAYEHASKRVPHNSAERMAYGFDIPILTPEQIARYLKFEDLLAM